MRQIGLLAILWSLLFSMGLSAAADKNKKKHRLLDEILNDKDAYGPSSGSEFESLVRYDKMLFEAYKSVTAELPPQPSNWGRLGMLFYERDRTYKQGGAAEAASQLRVAMQLAALNLKQRTMLNKDGTSALDDEYEEYDDEDVHSEAKRAKLEGLDSPERQIEQIGKWLEKSRRKNDVSEGAFVDRLREETFAWSLQYAILNSYLGLGTSAIKFLDFAAQYATSTDEADEETKYKAASDLAIVTYHRADVYLKNLNLYKDAAHLFTSFLELDGCSKEAGEARMKLVQADILAEEWEELKISASHKENVADARAAIAEYRTGRVQYWEERASRWAFEVATDPVYGVSRIAVHCHREREKALRWADSEDGGVRLMGQPTEQQHQSSPSLTGTSAGADAPRGGAVPPLSLMTRWALFSVHDHIATRLLAIPAGSPGAIDGEMEMRAEDHRQQAWENLEAAHGAERHFRTEGGPGPASDEAVVDGEEAAGEADGGNGSDGEGQGGGLDEFFFEVDPADGPGEIGRKGREQLKEHLDKGKEEEKKKKSGKGKKNLGWTLSSSVQKAQALKKIFNEGYWPPEHLGVGSNSTELVFIVGFFRSGSTLLERMLSASPHFVGIGEHSPVGMELRALEVAMLSNEKENEARAAKGEPKAAPLKAMRRAQEQVLMKMRARANGTMAYTGYQPEEDSKGYTRVPTGGDSADYSSRRIIDKMLLNYRSIGMIHLLFPKAAIIHLVRDPMDTLLSCYKTRFTDDSSIYTLHPATLAREYGLYLDIMRHFRQQLPPGRITDVSYTALVTQPRATLVPVLRQMRHVVQQEGGVPVELVWDEGMVRHHIAANAAMKSEGERNDDNSPSDVSKGVETLSPVSRTASYLQVKKPLYSSAVGSWLRYKEYSQALREAYRKYVYGPLLEQANGDVKVESETFPFGEIVNWQASTEYDYAGLVQKLHLNEVSPEMAAEEVGKTKRKAKARS